MKTLSTPAYSPRSSRSMHPFQRYAVIVALVAAAAAPGISIATGEARCSYFATFPSATGRNAYLLATATAESVFAAARDSYAFGRRTVRAQVMAIDDVAGFRAEEVRRGLRGSGGTAVFVRYRIDPGCGPYAPSDGAFDSLGVGGLYVGEPRPETEWIGGRPTFDIVRAPHFPLPQRFAGPSGHAVFTSGDPAPTMSATDLFAMYRGLWAESVTAGDTSVGRRIRRWSRDNPRAATMRPAEEVASGMLNAVVDAMITANPIPLVGSFAIHVVVPSVDSMTLYGQMWHRARPWMVDFDRDSATGLPVGVSARSFALDITTSASLEGFESLPIRIMPCPLVPIIVNAWPVALGADSTWQGETYPISFAACAPEDSRLAALARPHARHAIPSGAAVVTFRLHPGGRVSFEARTGVPGGPGILLRGERVSAATYGAPFD